MKNNRNNQLKASLIDANNGVAFTSIDGLPAFNESDYCIGTDDKRFSLITSLRNIVFPSLPSGCIIDNNYSGILATDFSVSTLYSVP